MTATRSQALSVHIQNLAILVAAALPGLRLIGALSALRVWILILLVGPGLWFMLEATLLTALLVTLLSIFVLLAILIKVASFLTALTHLVLFIVIRHLSLLSLSALRNNLCRLQKFRYVLVIS